MKNHCAEVVKLVDTHGSGPCGGNSVEVRVLSSALLRGSYAEGGCAGAVQRSFWLVRPFACQARHLPLNKLFVTRCRHPKALARSPFAPPMADPTFKIYLLYMQKKLIADKSGEVREITEKEMKDFQPARAVLPDEFFDGMKKLRGQRGPQKAPTKAPVSLRINPDVVAPFKKGGKG